MKVIILSHIIGCLILAGLLQWREEDLQHYNMASKVTLIILWPILVPLSLLMALFVTVRDKNKRS